MKCICVSSHLFFQMNYSRLIPDVNVSPELTGCLIWGADVHWICGADVDWTCCADVDWICGPVVEWFCTDGGVDSDCTKHAVEFVEWDLQCALEISAKVFTLCFCDRVDWLRLNFCASDIWEAFLKVIDNCCI